MACLFDEDNNHVRNIFHKILTVESADSEGLYKNVRSTFLEGETSFDKLLGFGSDGASMILVRCFVNTTLPCQDYKKSSHTFSTYTAFATVLICVHHTPALHSMS